MLLWIALLVSVIRPSALQIGTIKLSSGDFMPVLGLGTWQLTDERALTAVLNTALDNGYRLIDTAYIYNNEEMIGKILKEYFKTGRVKREDVFITTKLPPSAHGPADVEKYVNKQLKALQVDYIDLYLIHFPLPHQKSNKFDRYSESYTQMPSMIDDLHTWRAMEKLHDAGKLKALGLSNFDAVQLQDVYDHARIKPANLQVICNVYWPQLELHELCKKLNVSFTAYSPLGSPGNRNWNRYPNGTVISPLTDPVVKQFAEKYRKTPAQILLRYLIQRGITAIPKTARTQRVKENMDIFDFKLTENEMEILNSLRRRARSFA